MKNYLLLIFVLALCFGQTNAQDVPEVQRPLISKVAATWCPPCGGWGWVMFEDLIDENEENATLLVAHHSGDLTNSVAQDFSSNFNAPYQPYFYYNTEDQNATSSNAAAKRAEIKTRVDAAATESPVANAGIAMSMDNGNLNVTTRTRFFQEATGEYYLGVYFVESNIINPQAGRGNNAIHEKILTGAISSGSFGEMLDNGTIAAGTEFYHDFTASLDNMDLEHLEVITIIWKKEGNGYEVVNTNLSTEFQPTSSNELDLHSAAMEIYPTLVSSQATISLAVTEVLENAQLSLYNQFGQEVQAIYNGTIATGTATFRLNKEATNQGLHYVVLKNEGKVLSKSVIFE